MKALACFASIALICGLILIGIGSFTRLPQKEHVILNPIADATILFREPDKNTGQSDILISGYSESSTWNYSAIPFLMFDLTEIPSGTVEYASLNLYAENVTFFGGETFKVKVCFCTNITWSESGITYNEVLDFSSAIREEATDTQAVSTSGLWYAWNVKSDIEQALPYGKLAEVLLVQIEKAQTDSYAAAWFASKETENPPKLDVLVAIPENPLALWLFILGFAALCLAALLYLLFRKHTHDEDIRTGKLVEYVDRNGSKSYGNPEQVRRWKEQEEHEKELERLEAGERETVIKEIVKVRCRYCGQLFDSTLDKCPHCGGKR